MKKIIIPILMMFLLMFSVHAMVYSTQYSRFVRDEDKSSCNPYNSDCNTYRDYLELNYFDDARFFDDSGTKTSFLAKTGQSSYQVQIYFKFFDDAFYSSKLNNLTTTCIIWRNIFESEGEINSTTEFYNVFTFGSGNTEYLESFKLKGGETLQCTTDGTYTNPVDKRLTLPLRTDVIEPAYEIKDEAQCSKDVASVQSDVDKCNVEYNADVSQVNPSSLLVSKKVVYYTDMGLNIIYVLIKIFIIIGVIFLLFKVGFILYDVMKRESR